jgi:hypothetical protein
VFKPFLHGGESLSGFVAACVSKVGVVEIFPKSTVTLQVDEDGLLPSRAVDDELNTGISMPLSSFGAWRAGRMRSLPSVSSRTPYTKDS